MCMRVGVDTVTEMKLGKKTKNMVERRDIEFGHIMFEVSIAIYVVMSKWQLGI